MPFEAELSTRRRILEATHVVCSRSGLRNLLLADVAAEAQVSRPTLYRHFGSREGLLEALSQYEQDNFDAGMARAIAGLRGEDRLDAALQFVVDFQYADTSRHIVDIEPGYILVQTRLSLPVLEKRIRQVLIGDNADIAASAIVHLAICHYLLQGASTPKQFLAELRLAAGLDPRRRRRRGRGEMERGQ